MSKEGIALDLLIIDALHLKKTNEKETFIFFGKPMMKDHIWGYKLAEHGRVVDNVGKPNELLFLGLLEHS